MSVMSFEQITVFAGRNELAGGWEFWPQTAQTLETSVTMISGLYLP
jgi:hypothetical protein